MKRTFALVGLMAIGSMLLIEPDTGLVAVTQQVVSDTTARPTTTSEPLDTDADLSAATSPTTTVPSATSTPDLTTTAATTSFESGTVVGESVSSEFGDFQVEIVVEGGVMVNIVTLQEPGDRRSQNINDTAIPIYTEEALVLQSADFDAISGATVTWRSWGESLRTALERAGMA